MSWLIVDTVPDDDFPLVEGECVLREGKLSVGRRPIPVTRGASALISAACSVARVMEGEPPRALLAGDIGHGEGSRRVYRRLVETMGRRSEALFVFHYLLPDVDWHNRVLMEIEELNPRPMLVADAGYMYVAKMSGFAGSYDVFTPDAGETAFLADEFAPHPFYTRGFLLQEEEEVPDLIRRAYQNGNAASYLLAKGRCDYVASKEGIVDEIREPCVETMEPIGGTGDSLTGILGALLACGKSMPEAAILAAKANRMLGLLSNPTPAFTIGDLLPALPEAVNKVLSDAESSEIDRAAQCR